MQQTHLRLARTHRSYPWELSTETRRIGKQGLAKARAILEAKRHEPAQLTLDLNAAADHTTSGQSSTSIIADFPGSAPKPAGPSRLAA